MWANAVAVQYCGILLSNRTTITEILKMSIVLLDHSGFS